MENLKLTYGKSEANLWKKKKNVHNEIMVKIMFD